LSTALLTEQADYTIRGSDGVGYRLPRASDPSDRGEAEAPVALLDRVDLAADPVDVLRAPLAASDHFMDPDDPDYDPDHDPDEEHGDDWDRRKSGDKDS